MPIPDSTTEDPEWISCSQYAKRRGVSRMSVSTAIASGRLVKSVVRVGPHNVPKICDPDLADREWEANTDPVKRVAAAGNDPSAWVARPAVHDAPEGVAEQPDESEVRRAESMPEVATSTARAKHWDAELKELKFKESAGQLVPAADVEREWAALLSSVRGHLLGLPSRLKQSIPSLTLQDVELITQLVRDALDETVDSESKQ